MGLEVLSQLPNVEVIVLSMCVWMCWCAGVCGGRGLVASRKSKVIVLSVGGGGLLAGVAAYAKTGQIGQLAVDS